MPRVLLVGWDGAGWDRTHPLMDAGVMPALTSMVEKGVMGDTGVLAPLCSPLLWTTVATGQYADRHGVLDATEPDPVTSGVRPVSRASLRAVPVWDLLAREGLRSQVIGWPATHPARGPAVCVSGEFAFGAQGSIHPPALESKLLSLRFNPQEWTGDELHLFVPLMARIDQDKDKRLAKLAVILAEAVSIHAAATTLLESEPWDLTAVWFGLPGRASEIFPAGIDDDIYGEVINGVYRLLDLFLGRLLALAGPDAVVMLVSDRTAGESEWRDSGTGRGARGMLCAQGPDIQPDEIAFGNGLVDVVPTILNVFGFAPAPEMPGKTIIEISAVPPTASLTGPVLLPCPASSENTPPAELEDFGYTDSIAASWKAEGEAARQRRDFHLSRVLLAQGRAGEAIEPLERLMAANPDSSDVPLYLGHALFQVGRLAECRAICEMLLAKDPDSPYASVGRAHIALAEANYAEASRLLAASRESWGMVAPLDAVIGEAWLRLGRLREAARAFLSAIGSDSGLATAHAGLARAMLGLRQYEEAAEAALDAIRLRYDQPAAHETLAQALQALGRTEEAAEATRACQMLRGQPLPVA